jgi:hypothetical protein
LVRREAPSSENWRGFLLWQEKGNTQIFFAPLFVSFTILLPWFSHEFSGFPNKFCNRTDATLVLLFSQNNNTMSVKEILQFIYQKGVFTFYDGKQDEGMIVCRYNISAAAIEYYLIPSSNFLAYQAARSHADMDAHKKLGVMVDIGKIVKAQLFN